MLAPEDLIRLHNEHVEDDLRKRQLIRHAEAARPQRQAMLQRTLGLGQIAVAQWLALARSRLDQTARVPIARAGHAARSSTAGRAARPRNAR